MFGRRIQVLYMYSSIDDFMMNNLHEFSGKKLVTAEMSDVGTSTTAKPAAEASKPGVLSPFARTHRERGRTVPTTCCMRRMC